MTAAGGCLVFAESQEGKLMRSTAELLGAAAKVRREGLRGPITVALLGMNSAPCAQEAIALGAESVYVADDARLEHYQPEEFLSLAAGLCRDLRPDVVMFGHGAMSRDLAPKLAFRLETGLTMDCVDLGLEQGTGALLACKPVFGGNVLATYVAEHKPHIVTVRARTMEPAERQDGKEGSISTLSLDSLDVAGRLRTTATVKEEGEVKLEEATRIVGGGRGIGSPENFAAYLTDGLAKVLAAAVGGTRAAVDSKFIPSQLQIGLTGKIICPDLYFAVAISGAPQHMAGCSKSKCIVAINRDSFAPIFSQAHFGVVGDYQKVLTPLIARLRQEVSA